MWCAKDVSAAILKTDNRTPTTGKTTHNACEDEKPGKTTHNACGDEKPRKTTGKTTHNACEDEKPGKTTGKMTHNACKDERKDPGKTLEASDEDAGSIRQRRCVCNSRTPSLN